MASPSPLRSVFQAIGWIVALLDGVAAQTVLVVDAANGPGTNFTSLAVATQQAPSGAVLVVRPGTYTDDVTIAAKSLSVLGQAGAILAPSLAASLTLRITSLSAGQRVAVHGLQMAPPFFQTVVVRCEASTGEILLDGVNPAAGTTGRTRLEGVGCSALLVRESAFGQSLLGNSVSGFFGCVLPTTVGQAPAGLVQTGGATTFEGCSISGYSNGPLPDANAITLNGGSVRLSGGALFGGGGFSGGKLIAGSGTARIDPSVSVTSFPSAFAPTVQVTTAVLPRVRTTSGPVGTSVSAELFGASGDAGFLLASLPAVPSTVALFADPLWLDPATAVVQVAGVVNPAIPLVSATAIPALPALWGQALHWQGLTASPAGWNASNPAFYLAR